MRKYGLLAAAAGLALSGSIANADFIVSSSRQIAAYVNNGQSYDIVTFSVKSDGNNGTGTQLQLGDIAIQAPKSFLGLPFANNALVLGSVGGAGDVFAQGAEATQAHNTYIYPAINSNEQIAPAQSILFGDGSVDNSPITATNYQDNSSQTTDGKTIVGVGGSFYWSQGGFPVHPLGPTITSPVAFAQAVVPTGDPVQLIAPDLSGNRAFESNGTQFSAPGTNLMAASASPYTDLEGVNVNVPEPTSIGLLGMALGALGLRRRRA